MEALKVAIGPAKEEEEKSQVAAAAVAKGGGESVWKKIPREEEEAKSLPPQSLLPPSLPPTLNEQIWESILIKAEQEGEEETAMSIFTAAAAPSSKEVSRRLACDRCVRQGCDRKKRPDLLDLLWRIPRSISEVPTQKTLLYVRSSTVLLAAEEEGRQKRKGERKSTKHPLLLRTPWAYSCFFPYVGCCGVGENTRKIPC